MAYVCPFRGIRYNPEKVKNLSRVLTPPYDIISDKMQSSLYARHPYNFVRILLDRKQRGDNRRNNPYTRSASFFADWQRRKILIREKTPVIYGYLQEYFHRGLKRRRWGFLALLKLAASGRSLARPHEKTLDGPRQDRAALIEKIRADAEPVFIIFKDNKKNSIVKSIKGAVRKARCLADFKEDNVRHCLWSISSKAVIRHIRHAMREKAVYIADGHHRYAAALAYSRKNPRAGFILCYFAPLDNQALTILPTHRIAELEPYMSHAVLLKHLKKFFKIYTVPGKDAMLQELESLRRQRGVFGLYAGDAKFCIMLIKNPKRQKMDAALLDNIVLQNILGISDRHKEGCLWFSRDVDEAVRLAHHSRRRVAFFLNPTRLKDVQSAADCRKHMPQKSTYFYPKPLSGLVMHKF